MQEEKDTTTAAPAPKPSALSIKDLETVEPIAAPATVSVVEETPVKTSPKEAEKAPLVEAPTFVIAKKSDQELTGGFATKEPVIFSTPSSADALKNEMANRIRNDVASLEN